MITADPDTHTGTTDSDDDRLVDGLCYDLCRDCASRYHDHGWHKVTGAVKLRTGTVNEHD